MTFYNDIDENLDGVTDFELPVRGVTTVVRRNSPESWLVYLDEKLIGSFSRQVKGRATYYESEVASEPNHTNWVSDDVTVLVSRMIDLRD
ncbi:hypothetical protein [Microbacterium sp. As-52]|uniref:hypothetical protein n=1 Tax=Microbacterium sp. As-52 TaxID=3390503 RepID=UPI003CF327BB